MAGRHLPAAPLGPDGPYLAAILDVLDDINATLGRLAGPATVDVHIAEPTTPTPPDETIAVREPAPARNPNRRTGRR